MVPIESFGRTEQRLQSVVS